MMKFRSLAFSLICAVAFVAQASAQGAGQLGPGQIWANPNTLQGPPQPSGLTISGLLGAAPAYQAGNTAHSALYSALGAPPGGSTGIWNGFQFNVGTPIPASQQFGANDPTFGVWQGVVAAVSIPAGDVITAQASAFAGYALTNSPVGGKGAVAVALFGQGSTNVANGSVIAGNIVCQNNNGSASVVGFNMNYQSCLELDWNGWKLPGGADPTVTSGHAYGLVITGSSNLASVIVDSSAVVVGEMSVQTGIPWYSALRTYPGGAVNAVIAGPAGIGASQNSQPIMWMGTSAGNTPITAKMFSDSAASLYLDPGFAAAINLRDGSGNSLLSTGAGFGGSGVKINFFSAAGVVTNNASGVLASTTTLPTGLAMQTPASINLTNGTSLPISTGVSGLATNMAAFLASATSANLAAAVTDETGTGVAVFNTAPTFVTSITAPLLAGGSAAGSQLTIESTSGVGTTDAIIGKTASQVERFRVTTGGLFNIGGAFAPDSSSLVTVNSNAGVADAVSFGNPQLHLVGADTTLAGIYSDSYGVAGNQALYVGRNANGSRASKAAVAAGTTFFSIIGQTYDGAAYATNATMDFSTLNLQAAGDHGGYVYWRTVAGSTTTLNEKMRLNASGGFNVGTTNSDPGVGKINAQNGYNVGGTAGVSCAGALTGAAVVTNGIVTHC